MSEIKISVTIAINGAVPMKKEDYVKTVKKEIVVHGVKKIINKKVDNYDNMEASSFTLFDKVAKKVENYTVYVRKYQKAHQVINLPPEAYRFMTSSECPTWEKKKDWMRMSKHNKLMSHLKELAESFNGTLEAYTVFDD
jgi:hypothetical protein